jgi:phage protein D
VVQKNQDDALFLVERAKRIGFDCYVQADPDSGDDTLYFVAPPQGGAGRALRVYEFEWGSSLISFSASVSTSEQVGKVTVRGWDPRTKAAIVGSAGPEDLEGASGGGATGPGTEKHKEDRVVDMPVASTQEARALALALLTERANKFNKGNGRVIGLPDLRPNDRVLLKGLGTRFNGEYTVAKVTHSLGGSGYHTSFDVERSSDGGTT